MKKPLLKLTLLVVSTSAALLISEITARAVLPELEVEYGWGIEEARLRSTSNAYQARLAGGRGRSQFRILLVGDSQVVNSGMSPEILPATILETELTSLLPSNCGLSGERDRKSTDFVVLTLGEGGWGQDQQLLALKALIGNIQPNLVLSWFTPENDLSNNAFPTHFPRNGTRKPTYIRRPPAFE